MSRFLFKITIFSFVIFSNISFSQITERLPCVDKEFCVVVHIIKDSLGNPGITESSISTSIDSLNSYFSPICLSFKVCEFVYHDNHKYDSLNSDVLAEWPEMQVLYNQTHRINLYYVKKIVRPSGVCGFAGLGAIGSLSNNGIVIQKSPNCCSVPFKTIIHEFGHYFSLEHTFEVGNGAELVNGSNSAVAGDNVLDTPADPYVFPEPVTNYVVNCKFISMKKDANNQYYSPIVGNVMDYYPDTCLCGFTHDQLMKMAKYYLQHKGMW